VTVVIGFDHVDLYVASATAIPVLFLTTVFSPVLRLLPEKITDDLEAMATAVELIVPMLLAFVIGEVTAGLALILEEDGGVPRSV
jgi:hypothetical protein